MGDTGRPLSASLRKSGAWQIWGPGRGARAAALANAATVACELLLAALANADADVCAKDEPSPGLPAANSRTALRSPGG